MIPACHQDGLMSWKLLSIHLYGDICQDVPTAQAVEVEQDVACVACELNTAICCHGHSVKIWTNAETISGIQFIINA